MPTALIPVAIAAVVALWLAFTYNRLIAQTNLVREAWSGVDVQLKRRADLIPNLVATVKGYAQHERQLFDEVATLRARSLAAASVGEQTAVEGQLAHALRGLLAIAEAYPDLKADRSFLALQQELSAVEDELQLARRYYNGTVRDYNTLAQSLPSNLVAGLFHFKPAAYFEAEPAARAVPAVAV